MVSFIQAAPKMMTKEEVSYDSAEALPSVRQNMAVTARAPRVPIIPPPSLPPRAIDQFKMRFLFEKRLQCSDVGSTGRIVIPKRIAELHLPTLHAKEGTWLNFDDMDYYRVWTLKFRYWPNNNSRMYVFENTKNFISTHQLEVRDYVMIFKDDENESYVIRAKKSNSIAAAYDYNTTMPNAIEFNVIDMPSTNVIDGFRRWSVNGGEGPGYNTSPSPDHDTMHALNAHSRASSNN